MALSYFSSFWIDTNLYFLADRMRPVNWNTLGYILILLCFGYPWQSNFPAGMLYPRLLIKTDLYHQVFFPNYSVFLTRWFSNHKSRLRIHQSMWIQWPFLQKTWTKGHLPLDDLWPPHLLRSHVRLYPRIIVSKSHENTSKYVDTMTVFAITWTKVHWPLDDLWPHICWGLMCDSTQGSLCPRPMKIHQCGYSDLFAKKLEPGGHWPLDDLWHHICWGHMCDSTQGSLCPSPMKIHQSMWIQWPFLQKLEPKVIDP